MSRGPSTVSSHSLRSWLGFAQDDTVFLGGKSTLKIFASAVSRTRLWLVSGWGGRDRHLSRRRRNPGRRIWLLWCCLAARRLGLVLDERGRSLHRPGRCRDGREFSGI